MAKKVKDVWGYTYSMTGYMVTFNDTPVGGAGVSERPKHSATQRENVKLFKRLGEMTANECRKLHKTKPFIPTIYEHIWRWRKEVEAYV